MLQLPRSMKRVLLAASVAATLTAVAGIGLIQASASTPVALSGVQTVNQTGQSFAIEFQTATAYTGSKLEYGTSCGSTTTTVAETPSNGLSHLISVPGGLKPATTYYYKLIVGGTLETCRTAHTLAAQSVPPVPSTVFGVLRTNNCGTAVPGTLVSVRVQKVGGAMSLTYATITSSGGTWALPFGVTSMANGSYASPALGDTVVLNAVAPGGKTGSANLSYNGTSQIMGPKVLCTTANS